MAENVEINVNSNVNGTINQFKELKNSLRAAIGELAALNEGTAEYTAQAARVGALRDRVNALNESIAAVSGSPIENLSGSFGLLSQQVGSLDFEGATGSLSQFSGQVKNLKFSDITSGLKSFTSGLGSLGKAILTNPILLLAGVIVGLGVALYNLKDSIKPIGDLFEFIGDTIDGVVSSIKDFTDSIGLTNFAVQDKAKSTIDAAKKEQEAINQRYDAEIKIAEAAGKDTKAIEEAKRQEIYRTIKAQLDALQSLRAIQGEYTAEQLVQLQELAKQFNDIQTEKAVNNAKAEKQISTDNKAEYEKRKADNDKLRKDIAITNINAITDEETRAIKMAEFQKTLRDKEINATKADAETKRAALEASERQLQTELTAINKAGLDKRKKDADDKLQKDIDAARVNEDIANRDLIASAEREVLKNKNSVDSQINLLTAKKDADLSNENLTAQEKLLITEKYQNDVSKIKEDDAKKEKEIELQKKNATLDIATQSAQGLQSLSDLVFTIKSTNTKKGSAEEEKAARQQFKINKALAITTTTISTIQGVMNALSANSVIPEPFGTILKVATAAGVGVAGAANIAKISASQFGGTGGGSPTTSVGSGASSSSISSAASFAGPVSSQFKAETINQTGTTTGQPQRVYVVESDITNAQQKVSTIETQSKIG